MTRPSFAARVAQVARRVDLSRFPSPITIVVSPYEPDGSAAEVVLSMQVAHVRTGFPTTVNQSTVLDHFAIQARARAAGTFDQAVVAAVWDMAKRLVLHELQECLFVDGRQFEDPHADERPRSAGGQA